MLPTGADNWWRSVPPKIRIVNDNRNKKECIYGTCIVCVVHTPQVIFLPHIEHGATPCQDEYWIQYRNQARYESGRRANQQTLRVL